MRAVVQRVTSATVEVDDRVVGKIGGGVVVFVGVGRADRGEEVPEAAEPDLSPAGTALPGAIRGREEATALADKVANLRIFPDADGKTNLSLLDTGGSALVISQFTLYADCRRGRRPSFAEAADPGPAETLVEEFRLALERLGITTAQGRFAAHMVVSVVNDGPFTILLDTEALAAPRRRRRSADAGHNSPEVRPPVSREGRIALQHSNDAPPDPHHDRGEA